jgi:hypothetical protein
MTMLGAAQRVEATGALVPWASRILRSSGRHLQVNRLAQAFSELPDRLVTIPRAPSFSTVSVRAEVFARRALGLVLSRPLLSTKISSVAFASEVPWGNDPQVPWGDDDWSPGVNLPGFRAVFSFRDAGPPLVMTVRGGRHTFSCDPTFAQLL